MTPIIKLAVYVLFVKGKTAGRYRRGVTSGGQETLRLGLRKAIDYYKTRIIRLPNNVNKKIATLPAAISFKIFMYLEIFKN